MTAIPRSARLSAAAGLLLFAVFWSGAGQAAQSPPKPAAAAPEAAPSIDGIWPREIATSIGSVTIYQPQVDGWDGARLEFRAALSVKANAEAPPVFGVVWGSTRTVSTRTPGWCSWPIVASRSWSSPRRLTRRRRGGRRSIRRSSRRSRRSRSTASRPSLEEAAADKLADAVPVKNDPPKILFSTRPAILVYVDGAPVYQPVKDTKLERVINTRVLLLRHKSEHFVKVFDGWLGADTLEGPWKVQKETGDLKKALADAKASGQVDFLPGGNPNDAITLPSLKSGKVPLIFVATTPSELLVTEGEPEYVPIPGTALEYVKNTTGNMFRTPRTRSSTCCSPGAGSGAPQRRSLGVRGGRRAARGLRQDPRRQREGERQGGRVRHAAGEGGADRQRDPADGRGQAPRRRRSTRRSSTVR